MSDTQALPASHMYVDGTPEGDVVLSNIAEDDLATMTIFMTPAAAYRLAQMLISVAESIELP